MPKYTVQRIAMESGDEAPAWTGEAMGEATAIEAACEGGKYVAGKVGVVTPTPPTVTPAADAAILAELRGLRADLKKKMRHADTAVPGTLAIIVGVIVFIAGIGNYPSRVFGENAIESIVRNGEQTKWTIVAMTGVLMLTAGATSRGVARWSEE